jgi:hypothetical protein
MVLGRKASVMTKEKRGPRGGESTIYDSGLLRKTCYFYPEEWEAIRQEAFKRDTGYAEIIRESVRAYLRIDDKDDGLPSP